MFFLAWWRPGAPLREDLASRVHALLDDHRADRANTPNATLAAWSPAVLVRSDAGVTACGIPFAENRIPQGHPFVSLAGDEVRLVAPALTEYPAYYVRGHNDDFLLVCSRLAPLVRLLPDAPLNARRLACLIRWSSGVTDLDPGGTIYAAIRRIRGAERLVTSGGRITADRQFPRVGRSYGKGTPADFAQALLNHLRGAVSRLIDPAKRVAVLTSGGLDSSGILALAAAHCRGATPRELVAVSAQFASPKDDRPYFRALMSALGTKSLGLAARTRAGGFPAACVSTHNHSTRRAAS